MLGYDFLEFLTSVERDFETFFCYCEILEKIVVSDLCCVESVLKSYFHR